MGTIVSLDGVRAKVSPQAMKRGRYVLANRAMANMNSFVPRKNNIPRQSAHTKSDGSAILYGAKYARRQLHLNGEKYTTLGVGPRWDLKAKSLHMLSRKKVYLEGAGIQ